MKQAFSCPREQSCKLYSHQGCGVVDCVEEVSNREEDERRMRKPPEIPVVHGIPERRLEQLMS